jgi:hypothetical protein
MLKRVAFVMMAFVAAAAAFAALAVPQRIAQAEVGIAPGAGATCTQTISQPWLPYTINGPGVFCLSGTLTHTTNNSTAITINNNGTVGGGAVLDLGGYALVAGGTGQTAISVTGNGGYVIRNGRVQGFATGISVAGGGNIRVEKMQVEAVTTGFALTGGTSVVIEDTQVYDSFTAFSVSGGGNYVIKGCHAEQFSYGVNAPTSGSLFIKDNTFANQSGSIYSVINFPTNDFTGYAVVERNEIIAATGDGIVWSGDKDRLSVRGNDLMHIVGTPLNIAHPNPATSTSAQGVNNYNDHD